MNEIPPAPGGEASDAEKGPYTEAMLDVEIETYVSRLKKLYEEELEKGGSGRIGNAKFMLDKAIESPFWEFTNNFFNNMPGGGKRISAQKNREMFADEPEMLAEVVEPEEKKAADVDRVLARLKAEPELAARAGQSSVAHDTEALDLLRKVYVGMRNLGYTHAELWQ